MIGIPGDGLKLALRTLDLQRVVMARQLLGS
jgi:hypothetical protein